MLSEMEYKTIEVIVKFPCKSLYESYLGHTMHSMLQRVYKHYGWSDDPLDVIKELESKQFIVNHFGTLQFTSLCPCGRCCKYVPRTLQVEKIVNKEATQLNWVREVVLSGELVAMKGKKDVELPEKRKVNKKLSKTQKPKIKLKVVTIENVVQYRLQKKEETLKKIKTLKDNLKEWSA